MKKFCFAIVFAFLLTSLLPQTISSQSFLAKYPQLTNENLELFMLDWKSYSDSIAATNPSNDSCIINREMRYIYTNERSVESEDAKYYVLPIEIPITTYEADVNIENLKSSFMDIDDCLTGNADSITQHKATFTPALPAEGLYLTESIYDKLAEFTGLQRDSVDNVSDLKEENVDVLQQYISVFHGHWGGYWHFETLPCVTGVERANNIIVINRRTTWCTGDEIIYLLNNGKWQRDDDARNSWIE